MNTQLSTIIELVTDVLIEIKNQSIHLRIDEPTNTVSVDVCHEKNWVEILFNDVCAKITIFRPQNTEDWGFWKNLDPPQNIFSNKIEYANPDFVKLVLIQIKPYLGNL